SGLFAAKEAVSKALGTGIGKVAWQDIEILHEWSGEPILHLHGNALLVAQEKGLRQWSVSITHDGGLAAAVAVAIGDPG
ncbi:MAG TPA: ACP synthase, partial [Anaerolineaceae bacterium]|nr:ACP synthase [Anaerolineaceae bacterium]